MGRVIGDQVITDSIIQLLMQNIVTDMDCPYSDAILDLF